MCGVIGAFGPRRVSGQLYAAARVLKNRGRSGSGILTLDNVNVYSEKNGGDIKDLLSMKDLNYYEGRIGIAHTRYSTTGSNHYEELKRNAQPEYMVAPIVLGVGHNGNIYNYRKILDDMNAKPRSDCDVQALLHPMHKRLKDLKGIDEDKILDASLATMEELKGSYSAVFMGSEGGEKYLYGFTDPYKVRPLVVGKKKDDVSDENFWFISSETNSLKRIGAEYVMDVPGGSVLFVRPEEEKPHYKKLVNKRPHNCMFEWVYFSNQNSEINGLSVYNIRKDLGKRLAKRHPSNSDIVVPIPKTGWPYAIGYSQESGLPIEEGMIKYKKTRTFMLQEQSDREMEALENVEVMSAVVDGQDITLVDDSLVRGTNMRNYIKKFRQAGAKKIDVRIGCPPVMSPCYLGIDMKTKKEFAIRDGNDFKNWDEIADDIGADSLAYIDIKDLKSVIKVPNDDFKLCTGCIEEMADGYPPDMRDDVKELFSLDDGNGRVYEKYAHLQ